jgi:hypothetical protein
MADKVLTIKTGINLTDVMDLQSDSNNDLLVSPTRVTNDVALINQHTSPYQANASNFIVLEHPTAIMDLWQKTRNAITIFANTGSSQ